MGKCTHDCACDFGYAGGHEPKCEYSEQTALRAALIALADEMREQAIVPWPSLTYQKLVVDWSVRLRDLARGEQ